MREKISGISENWWKNQYYELSQQKSLANPGKPEDSGFE
jgi:hypothetical protein